MCRMGFDRNFPEKDNLICFGLGLSLRNENKLPFCLDRQYIPRSIILLTVSRTGIGSSTAHL